MRSQKQISIAVERAVETINNEKSFHDSDRVTEICQENDVSESHIREIGHWHNIN